jgi:hypothetical protein
VAVLGHGEPDSRHWFAEEIRRLHPKMRVEQPEPGQEIEA